MLKELSMRGSLKEQMLLTKKNVLDVAIDFLQPYTGFLAGKFSGLTIESMSNIFPFTKEVVYAFKEMMSEDIEAALAENQNRTGSIAEQEESTGDSLLLGALLLNKSKMVNSPRNWCLYSTEEEYRVLIIREGLLESKNCGSSGPPSDEVGRMKHVILHEAG